MQNQVLKQEILIEEGDVKLLMENQVLKQEISARSKKLYS
jgi:hypothetical protein